MLFGIITYSGISAIYGEKSEKNLNASLQKRTNSLIHAQSLCSVAYLASFLSRAGRLQSFSLQEVINLLTFSAFFSFGTKGQKPVSQMGLFSLPTNLHFSQTWNLKFYPNSNEIKSGQGSRKVGCQKFSVFLHVFHQKYRWNLTQHFFYSFFSCLKF